jgi:hypothetical protein
MTTFDKHKDITIPMTAINPNEAFLRLGNKLDLKHILLLHYKLARVLSVGKIALPTDSLIAGIFQRGCSRFILEMDHSCSILQ